MKKDTTQLELIKMNLLSRTDLDTESLEYYQGQYSKLTDLETITIVVSDYSGNKTNFHSLNIESLIFLIDLVIKARRVQK